MAYNNKNMILKYQEGGDFSPENIQGIIDGTIMAQTGAEARAAAMQAGLKSYYWAGSTIPLTQEQPQEARQIAPPVPLPIAPPAGDFDPNAGEFPTARSRAIADAKMEGRSGYQYGGENLPYPPTAAPQIAQDNFGGNPGEDLRFSNLDAIGAGEVMPRTRDEAFAAYRRAGKDQFEWGGQTYHTKTKEDIGREQRANNPGISRSITPRVLMQPDEPMANVIQRQDEYEGILKGPQVRKNNRQQRQTKRAGKKESRQIYREDAQDTRRDNKRGRQDERRAKNRQ